MKVLVACEESQAVCSEFRKLGHTAYSCDLQECSGGHPEWHIQGDALKLINGNCTFTTQDGTEHRQDGKWDLLIAHPPCTDLAISGASWFKRKRENGVQAASIELFGKFLWADCDHIAIENPVGVIGGEYVKKWFPELAVKYGLPWKPTQIIQPWMFGDNHRKTTCLWLIGLPKLKPEVSEEPELEWFEWTDENGKVKRQPKWYADIWFQYRKQADRAKLRSKTFPGTARAMAEQWGGKV